MQNNEELTNQFIHSSVRRLTYSYNNHKIISQAQTHLKYLLIK